LRFSSPSMLQSGGCSATGSQARVTSAAVPARKPVPLPFAARAGFFRPLRASPSWPAGPVPSRRHPWGPALQSSVHERSRTPLGLPCPSVPWPSTPEADAAVKPCRACCGRSTGPCLSTAPVPEPDESGRGRGDGSHSRRLPLRGRRVGHQGGGRVRVGPLRGRSARRVRRAGSGDPTVRTSPWWPGLAAGFAAGRLSTARCLQAGGPADGRPVQPDHAAAVSGNLAASAARAGIQGFEPRSCA
jgi:hypothetical protein